VIPLRLELTPVALFAPLRGVEGSKMPVPDSQSEAIVVEFKPRDDPLFKKTDHDLHGELSALAARSGTSCDSCGTYGLVPTVACEEATIRDVDLVCSECG
jgi:hypothetical protein